MRTVSGFPTTLEVPSVAMALSRKTCYPVEISTLLPRLSDTKSGILGLTRRRSG